MKKKVILFSLGLLATLSVIGISFFFQQIEKNDEPRVESTVENTSENFSYKGVEGKDALTLLSEQTEIERDRTGIVISINGKKAENTKREYWAFYVNGKMAQVGPADYVTKNNDVIEWRIEKY